MRKALLFTLAFALVVSFTLTASAYQVISSNILNPSTGNTLRGLLYMPEINSGQKIPLVICAHESESNHYGEALAAERVAVYTFKFDEDSPEMTRVQDLESVIESANG